MAYRQNKLLVDRNTSNGVENQNDNLKHILSQEPQSNIWLLLLCYKIEAKKVRIIS